MERMKKKMCPSDVLPPDSLTMQSGVSLGGYLVSLQQGTGTQL